MKRGTAVDKFSFRSGIDQDYCQIDEIEARAGDIFALDQLVGHRLQPDILGVEVEVVGQVRVVDEQHLAMTPGISDDEKMRVIVIPAFKALVHKTTLKSRFVLCHPVVEINYHGSNIIWETRTVLMYL